MKNKSLLLLSVCLMGLTVTGCGEDFLTSSSAEQRATGESASEAGMLSFLTSAYQPLLFDSYADNNYNSLPLMSDFRSDDIYKGGGSADDQLSLYYLSQFTSTPTTTVAGLWNVCYSGIARCNYVLIAGENTVGVSEEKLAKFRAEAFFLRAYYTHILWKLYGNVPYFTGILADAPSLAPQYTADEIYGFIMEDLAEAGKEDVLPMRATGADVGRASLAAALMLKARVVLYQKDESRYAEITGDMAAIIADGSYTLYPDFDKLWEDDAEFCDENIFETNQLPEGKTWSEAWQGYGTNLPAFIGPSELKDPAGVFKGGWAFAPVREQAYAMYESGDLRRDASINFWPEGSYAPRFQNTGYFLRKYAPRDGYNPPPGDQDLNYANNLRIFRYAETLLNYVELVKMHGQSEALGVSADAQFAAVRERAFGANAPALPATTENIKLERRREFLGEGMRFWDIIRWGDATTVLTENDVDHNSSRTFTEKKKYLPIPQSEIDKTKGTDFELKQNEQ
ncbi:MAG: RagB/SusD family nutrient uptake outer membrane protein [Tannerellaceae bacterium]|nr:RagB/SusD family nutrient uptake outer membrane protein [Tannerellaceae bacterium]